MLARWKNLIDRAAHHHFDQIIFVQIRNFSVTHKSTIAKNGITIRNMKDFIKFVTDE